MKIFNRGGVVNDGGDVSVSGVVGGGKVGKRVADAVAAGENDKSATKNTGILNLGGQVTVNGKVVK